MSIDLVKGQFDVNKFNQEFESNIQQQKEIVAQQDAKKLQELNKVIYKQKISEMTFIEFIHNWKESLLGMLNDLLHLRLQSEILFQENRLFFLGITVIFAIIFFYLFFMLINENTNNNTNRVINEYHVYPHFNLAKPM